MRVYIESTIPSYVVARPSRDLDQAARQRSAQLWWKNERHGHQLFVSDLVHAEISRGEPEMAQKRLALVAGIPVLSPLQSVETFATKIISGGVLPAFASVDAAHIALAAAHKMDILLTRNCRHIANAAIQSSLRRLAAEQGLQLPTICNPSELLKSGYEETDN